MNLGMAAVGIIIFLLVGSLLITAIELSDTYTGASMAITIIVCLYCTISGTYLLHLAGYI